MKRILLILSILISSIVNGQIQYEIKLDNSSYPDTEEVKYIQSVMYSIFDNMPTYNEMLNTFYVKSNVDIDPISFKEKMFEFGHYSVLVFAKYEYSLKENENN